MTYCSTDKYCLIKCVFQARCREAGWVKTSPTEKIVNAQLYNTSTGQSLLQMATRFATARWSCHHLTCLYVIAMLLGRAGSASLRAAMTSARPHM